MATKVLVPLLGEGVEEVTVTKWLKQEGETVKELEPLLEVNTDKVDTEIPAPASGTVLKIVAQEGLPAKVGTILALIGKPGESLDISSSSKPNLQAAKPSAADSQSAQVVPQRTMEKKEIGFISPVVAKMAAEHGVNLSEVQGTGLNGRVTKNDVMNFVKSGGAASVNPSNLKPANMQPMTGDQLIKHSVVRKQIAQHMMLSKQTSPHVLTVMEADLTRVLAHQNASTELFARDGVKLTLTAYFLMAIVAGLKAFPLTNSSWTEAGVLVHKAIHIGMATSLGEEGLIVPVIKNADNLSLLAMARSVNDLASRARGRKLQPDEVKGGTFTLTNHGVSKSLFAFPIINQPQCGILGVGAMQKRAVVINDAIAIRPMVYLSFVFDHRILDGASADWFLMKVKEALENWS
ncbi:MAG TPA: dihydrolipoamide acetyltransferase family protein [Anaerolineales bacterium]|nr:dihydrolipoamide acetyltransferase family protein [Anaerolineales bacterium]